ncbi:MAG: hypothetical protein NC548_22785 [Lachnospiraceae bacterium]|nr:hypothetical protein [Lachnospiraceae bacterium]
MVAPSYKDFPIIGEPFDKNGRPYVKVLTDKGTYKDVRWYSDLEYAKLYKKASANDVIFMNLKKVRGFSKGPIQVVRGNVAANEDWLRVSSARYAVGIGWYFVSDEPLPVDLRPDLHLFPLTWEEFRDKDDNHMKSPKELEAIIKKKEASAWPMKLF